nr:lysozyme inhibitor LprI family protein [uncultured Duganella sp.]
MKITKYAMPLVVSSLLSAGAWADCAAPATQSEMTQCAGQAYSAADKKLNLAYNEYRARLGAEQKKQLTQAQQAWIKYRDLSCAFESSGVEGGSAYPMVRSACLAAKTESRLKEITALLDCKEGDMSCPAHK